jgi:hypothetical protein
VAAGDDNGRVIFPGAVVSDQEVERAGSTIASSLARESVHGKEGRQFESVRGSGKSPAHAFFVCVQVRVTAAEAWMEPFMELSRRERAWIVVRARAVPRRQRRPERVRRMRKAPKVRDALWPDPMPRFRRLFR